MLHTPLTPHAYPTWIKVGFMMCSIFFILCLSDFSHYFYFHREMKKAKKSFEMGNYEIARLYYTQLSSQFPNNKRVKLGLTYSLFKSKQPEAHRLAFETLAELSFTTHEYNELLRNIPLKFAMQLQTMKHDNV